MEDQKTKRRGFKKIRNISLTLLVLALITFLYFRFYFPFGEGVKTGQLNYVVYKGVLFKTYEGKLIQSGYWSSDQGGIQSNEFIFSITDPVIADSLMHSGGQIVELGYKEYFGALPWRGHSKYVVNRIINITPISSEIRDNLPPVF